MNNLKYVFLLLSFFCQFAYANKEDSLIEHYSLIIENSSQSNEQALAAKKLAIVYANAQEHELSLERFLQSADFFAKSNNEKELSKAYTNIGNCYSELGNFDKANSYYNQRLSYSQNTRDTSGIISARMNLGVCLHQQGKYNLALEQLQPAYKLAIKINDKEKIVRSSNNIIACFNELHQFNKSLELIRNNISNNYINDPLLSKSVYLNAGETFKHLGHNDSAMLYFELYAAMQDSLYTIEKTRAIHDIESKYKVAEHQSEIKQLWLWLLAAFLGILIMASVLYFRIKQSKLKQDYERQLSVEVLNYQENFRKSLGVDIDMVVQEYLGHIINSEVAPEKRQLFENFFDEMDQLSQSTYNMKIGTKYWVDALKDLQGNRLVKVDLEVSKLPVDLPKFQQMGIYRVSEELIKNYKDSGAKKLFIKYIYEDGTLSIHSKGDSNNFKESRILNVLVDYFQGNLLFSKEGNSQNAAIDFPDV